MSDLRQELTTLLDRAEGDGGRVIAIAAIRRAIAGQPTPPPKVHVVSFAGDGPTWLLYHPNNCPGPDCPTAVAARKTLTLASYAVGDYEAWVGRDGWLCTQEVQP